jgi:hypothetical protein
MPTDRIDEAHAEISTIHFLLAWIDTNDVPNADRSRPNGLTTHPRFMSAHHECTNHQGQRLELAHRIGPSPLTSKIRIPAAAEMLKIFGGLNSTSTRRSHTVLKPHDRMMPGQSLVFAPRCPSGTCAGWGAPCPRCWAQGYRQTVLRAITLTWVQRADIERSPPLATRRNSRKRAPATESQTNQLHATRRTSESRKWQHGSLLSGELGRSGSASIRLNSENPPCV